VSVDKAYLALHPETAHGAIGNGREKSGKVCHSTFADDTAKTGVSGMVPIVECLSTHRTGGVGFAFPLPKKSGEK